MKSCIFRAVFVLSILGVLNTVNPATAATYYVWTNSPANGPGTNWATAFHEIQSAVDVTTNGDTVLVTNGTYILSSQISITNGIILESVNGAAGTIVDGNDTTRCLLLSNSNAHVVGFTITHGNCGAGQWGGGVSCDGGTLTRCILKENKAGGYGGGISRGTLYSCVLVGNSATSAGGAAWSTLYNCTVVSNSSATYGAGTFNCTAYSSIIYYNKGLRANEEIYANDVIYSCASRELYGTGNITDEPGILSLSNPVLLGSSPCIGAGSNQEWMASALDVAGNPRLNGTVDIGAYEFYSTDNSGPLTVAFSDGTGGAEQPLLWRFASAIEGPADGYEWDFGDGQVCSNLLMTSHLYGSNGSYQVVLKAFNSATVAAVTNMVHIVEPTTRYVSPTGSHQPPYTSWSTAATNIQDAIDASAVRDVVLVTNGVYDIGGIAIYDTMTNRIALTKPVKVISVNGPEVTIINGRGPIGDGAVRCAYGTNGAALCGFTLSGGCTRDSIFDDSQNSGGGIYADDACFVSNCIIDGNSAGQMGGGVAGGRFYRCVIRNNYSDEIGGGCAQATLWSCSVVSNRADQDSGGTTRCDLNNSLIAFNIATNSMGGGFVGGASMGTLRNCTIVRNHSGAIAGYGGSTSEARLMNCIVRYNTSIQPSLEVSITGLDGRVDYSCLAVDPGGIGNITNEPQFVDWSGGDFRLSPGSPCINTGDTAQAAGSVDLDGRPRVLGGTVDIGAYEFPSATGTHYVSPSGLSVYPYTNWSIAATNIQDAVDAALDGEEVLVTNGVYDTGGRAVEGSMTNRVALTKAITLRSVNGPETTAIMGQGPLGDGAVRCVYMTNGATLEGFSVFNGSTRMAGSINERRGGGILAEPQTVVSNCLIASNSSYGEGGGYCGTGTVYSCTISNNVAGFAGGGASYGTLWNCVVVTNTGHYGGGTAASDLHNCLVMNNTALYAIGGGSAGGTLYGCRVIGNSALQAEGGGTAFSYLYNCIVTGNSATLGGGSYCGTLYNCTLTGNRGLIFGGAGYAGSAHFGPVTQGLFNCIIYHNGSNPAQELNTDAPCEYNCTPANLAGIGNITNDPQFVDWAGGDFRLSPGSPCINAGDTAQAAGSVDLDGRPRVLGGIVDMGALEYGPLSWTSSFTIESPVEGSASTQRRLGVEWCGQTILGTARIDLWQGTNFICTLTNNLAATSTNMIWSTQLSGLPPGTNYWIRITDVDNSFDSTTSGFFTILSNVLPWLFLLLGE